MPLYRGAASKAILANMKARTVRALYEAHGAEMVEAGFAPDWEGVKGSLRRIRSTRICVTYGELDPGMTGIAAPLRNAAGLVDASLGFVLPDSDCSRHRLTLISEAMAAGADEIDLQMAKAIGREDVG